MSDDGIAFSNKELFAKLDSRFEELLHKMEQGFMSQNSEIRDVRHRVANLEAWKELQHAVDERQRAEFADLKTVFNQAKSEQSLALNAFRQELQPIKDYVNNQKGLDTYRKWLFMAGVTIAGLIVAVVGKV